MQAIGNVKIGFKNYKIEPLVQLFQGEIYGACSYSEEFLKICGKLPQHDRNLTLIHELLHCICKRFAITDLNQDEQTLDLLATGLYEAIKDNPHIFHMEDI